MGKDIPLSDLPRYSPWPARLLGLEDWKPRVMDRADVLREYDDEKWGPLKKRLDENPDAGIDDVEGWEWEGWGEALCSFGQRLELKPHREAVALNLDMVAQALAPHLPASALVELGAGYGGVFLRLAARPEFSGMKFFAGDISPRGVGVLDILSRRAGLDAACGVCDLTADPVTGLPVPPGALVYTSYAMPYATGLSEAFVDALSRLRPRAVVHVEPVPEHAPDNLLGMLRRAYMRINDYDMNLLSVLKEAEARGKIEIIEERPEVFGIQPLLTPSVVSWRPVDRDE